MGKFEKLVQKILSGQQDAAVNFSETVSLMRNLGFSLRTNGSHHIFYRADIEEIINIQPNGAKAKPYQVAQIRSLMLKYKLEAKDD